MDMDALADQLYEAAVIPELMPAALDGMAAIAGAGGGLMFAMSEYGAQWCASASIRHHIEDFLARGLADRNERAVRLVASGHMGFLRDHDVFTDEEMSRDEVYRDFLRPIGYGWGAATYVPVPNGDSIVLALEREYRLGPVPLEAVRQLDRIRPHFARAALVASRLRLERAADTVSLLSRFGIPAAVLDARGSLIAANDAFEALGPQLQSGAFNRLRMADRAADAQFREAFAAPGHAATMRSIVVPALDDRPALVVHLAPVRRQANDFFTNGAFLVIATPPSAAPAPSHVILNALYDLTPAESRIASMLMDGFTADEIATQVRVSRETVRTHTKNIYAKTGSRSQAHLTARLTAFRVQLK